MNLYDSIIKKALTLFKDKELISFPLESNFPMEKKKGFIFSDDTKVELGSNDKSAYFMGYTTNEKLISKDEILLFGKDLNLLNKESCFAHLSFFLLENEGKEDQQTYRLLRDLEYSRYNVFPNGYMLRINTNSLKEGARVSKKAIENGISFKDIGMAFLNSYKKEKSLRYVKQIFVTDPSFDFSSLLELQKEVEAITIAFDHILKNLKMDCKTCSFKEICDTVEGMKDLHKNKN